MFNLLDAAAGTGGTATVSLDGFLQNGTKLLTWIGEGMVAFLNKLMEHPVTSVFLIVGLAYLVIGVVQRFTR